MNELCWFRITQSRLKIGMSKLTDFLSWLDLTPLPADLPQAVFLVFQLPAPSPFWSSPLLWRCPRTLDRSPTWATEVPPRNMPCFQYFEQRNRRNPYDRLRPREFPLDGRQLIGHRSAPGHKVRDGFTGLAQDPTCEQAQPLSGAPFPWFRGSVRSI